MTTHSSWGVCSFTCWWNRVCLLTILRPPTPAEGCAPSRVGEIGFVYWQYLDHPLQLRGVLLHVLAKWGLAIDNTLTTHSSWGVCSFTCWWNRVCLLTILRPPTPAEGCAPSRVGEMGFVYWQYLDHPLQLRSVLLHVMAKWGLAINNTLTTHSSWGGCFFTCWWNGVYLLTIPWPPTPAEGCAPSRVGCPINCQVSSTDSLFLWDSKPTTTQVHIRFSTLTNGNYREFTLKNCLRQIMKRYLVSCGNLVTEMLDSKGKRTNCYNQNQIFNKTVTLKKVWISLFLQSFRNFSWIVGNSI